jgi:hypothetical protein
MVIGERFAWCHMQKTGGDVTLQLFNLFPQLVVQADPRNTQAKHASFAEREDQIRGKLLACNIRRLPAWLLSWDQHHSQLRSLSADGTPVVMSSPQQLAELPRADRRLAHFTDGGRFHIDRWLRLEHLAEDFAGFIAHFADLTDDRRHDIEHYPQVNTLEYDHDLEHWFTPEQVRRMYESNPVWAALEERVYGDLVSL